MHDLTYLSLGAGVQSSALYIMSVLGIHGCPRANFAIFADTQSEPQWVYDQLEKLESWGGDVVPVVTVSKGNLEVDALKKQGSRAGSRFVCIPSFTMGPDGRAAILRRHCTREYKIDPIERHVRKALGYEPRQRIKKKAAALIGISLDEVSRMKTSRTPWVDNMYPLVDAKLRRSDCSAIVVDNGFEIPRKSSCVFCPFHSDSFWRDLKQNAPDEFQRAVRFDEEIRDSRSRGLINPVYLHRSLTPLGEINFQEDQLDLFDNECEGACGL